MDAQIDPRLALVAIAVGATTQLAEKLLGVIHQNADDDAELAALVAESDARIARRTQAGG